MPLLRFYWIIFLQELYDVIGTAAHNFCSKTVNAHLSERDVRREMMELTTTSLRRFVNDEINELEFGVRVVAGSYLKRGTGLLFVMVHSPVEEKVVEKCLKEVAAKIQPDDSKWSDDEIASLGNRQWELLVRAFSQPFTPFVIEAPSDANGTTGPRCFWRIKILFVAKRDIFHLGSVLSNDFFTTGGASLYDLGFLKVPKRLGKNLEEALQWRALFVHPFEIPRIQTAAENSLSSFGKTLNFSSQSTELLYVRLQLLPSSKASVVNVIKLFCWKFRQKWQISIF